MKKKVFAFVMALGMSGLASVAAENRQNEIKTAAAEIDQMIVQAPRQGYVKDASGKKKSMLFQPVKPETYFPALTEMLKINRNELQAALKKTKYQLSDVIFARILSAKKEVALEEVLQERSTDAWIRQLAQNDIPLEEVQKVLQNIYVEMAYLSLESRS